MENYKENKIAIRLLDEWRIHGKPIIALDFDDTISPWKMCTQEECDKVINTVLHAQEVGIVIVVFTACKSDRYDEIRKYCINKGLIISSINENPFPLPYGNDRKIYYNHLLDDRAGLALALDILDYCSYVINSEKHPITIQTTEF